MRPNRGRARTPHPGVRGRARTRNVDVSNQLTRTRPRFFKRVTFRFSASQGPGDDALLPLPRQERRLGVAAELRHHCPQQSLVSSSLHRQRQLRAQVSGYDRGSVTTCGTHTCQVQCCTWCRRRGRRFRTLSAGSNRP